MINAIEARTKTEEKSGEIQQQKIKMFYGIEKHIEKEIKKAIDKGNFNVSVWLESFNKELKYEKVPLSILKQLYDLGYRVKDGYAAGNYIEISWEDKE
jgi:uncharacterized protein YicC (UPF0701 family)